MLCRNIGRLTVLTCACVLALACGIQLFRPASSHAQNGRASKGKLSTVQAEELNWPLPPGVDKSYDRSMERNFTATLRNWRRSPSDTVMREISGGAASPERRR